MGVKVFSSENHWFFLTTPDLSSFMFYSLSLLLSDSVLGFKSRIKIGINYTTALLRKQVPL